MSPWALIFHMNTSCDMTFPWIPTFLTLWSWLWSLTYFLKTLTLHANNFWTVSASASIFHMSFSSDRTFPWKPRFLTLWLTLESGLLFEYFILVNNIWIASARALIFTWIFLVIRSFCWYLKYFDLNIWPIFKKNLQCSYLLKIKN